MTAALNSPYLPTRKIVLDILVLVAYLNDHEHFQRVIAALETLSTANNEPATPFAYWFKTWETALHGRGRLGTLVGASEDIKKHGGVDPSLNDYTVCHSPNLCERESHRRHLTGYQPPCSEYAL